jgi:hypothetical protein
MGTFRLLGNGAQLTAGQLTVGGTALAGLEDPGNLSFEAVPNHFEVTRSLEFGRAARYLAVPGTTLTFRGDQLRLDSNSPESMTGLQATELLFQSPGADATPLEVQVEVAGHVGGAGSLSDNFAWGKLRVPEQTTVLLQLQDMVDNQSDRELPEALFIQELVLDAGGVLMLEGASRVYYQTLTVHPTASIVAADGQLLQLSPVSGDFSGDGTLDTADLDQLQAAFGSNTARLDLNANQVVDQADVRIWLHDMRGTWYGDANLDGLFETDDLVQIFAGGQYEDSVADNSNWESGDFDGDRDFTTTDLVFAFQDGGYRRGPRAAVWPVPEPAGCGSFLLLALCAVRSARKSRS